MSNPDFLRLGSFRALSPEGGERDEARPLAAIERLLQPKPRPRPGEKCEMCAVDVPDEHSHIVNLESRSLLCACRPCYLLFTSGGAGGGRYRAVPDRYVSMEGVALSPSQWDDLQIPVSTAFFFFNSEAEQLVAFYPSPAGATESLLPVETWAEMTEANPTLTTMEPDTEALLVRVGDRSGPDESFIVPIDACYELVGHLRRLWRGFDGGTEAHQAMADFFTRVRGRAKPASVDPAPTSLQ